MVGGESEGMSRSDGLGEAPLAEVASGGTRPAPQPPEAAGNGNGRPRDTAVPVPARRDYPGEKNAGVLPVVLLSRSPLGHRGRGHGAAGSGGSGRGAAGAALPRGAPGLVVRDGPGAGTGARGFGGIGWLLWGADG